MLSSSLAVSGVGDVARRIKHHYVELILQAQNAFVFHFQLFFQALVFLLLYNELFFKTVLLL